MNLMESAIQRSRKRLKIKAAVHGLAFGVAALSLSSPVLADPPGLVTKLNPVSVTAVDVNGDGWLDLCVSNYGAYAPPYTGSMSVFLGKGNGTFMDRVDYPTGDASWGIRAGDFDLDGKLDLVVANYAADGDEQSSVSVMLGNGDGAFRSAVNYKAGNGSCSVAIADYDSDGKPDLAVADWRSNSVSILHGNGDGTFAAASEWQVGDTPKSVASGDFNHDGIVDLAVADYGDSTISVLLAGPAGSFEPKTDYGVGQFPGAVVVADFDSDGNVDLAAASVLDAVLWVYPGVGDGTFGPRVGSPIRDGPWEMTTGDVNGDGKLDLITANATGNTTSILLGDGLGAFRARSFCTGPEPMCVSVGDFNGDGWSDLALACNGRLPGLIDLILGDGQGAFGDTTCVNLAPSAIPAELTPNPCHGAFTLGVSMREGGPLSISIYDIQGRRVAMPQERVFSSGIHEVAMDASSWSLRSKSGVYFVRLTSRSITTVHKLVVLP